MNTTLTLSEFVKVGSELANIMCGNGLAEEFGKLRSEKVDLWFSCQDEPRFHIDEAGRYKHNPLADRWTPIALNVSQWMAAGYIDFCRLVGFNSKSAKQCVLLCALLTALCNFDILVEGVDVEYEVETGNGYEKRACECLRGKDKMS